MTEFAFIGRRLVPEDELLRTVVASCQQTSCASCSPNYLQPVPLRAGPARLHCRRPEVVPLEVSSYFVIVTLTFWGHCDRKRTADRCRRKEAMSSALVVRSVTGETVEEQPEVGLRERKKA